MQENNLEIKNVHDKYFRSTFSQKEVSIDLFKHHLPPDIFKKINIDSLTLTTESFVDPKFIAKYSDIVYKAKLDGHEGYIYILGEHQSTNDKYIGIRPLEYTLAIMRHYMKQNNTNKAPIVLSILVYAGKNPYTGPYAVKEIFENSEIAEEIMFKNFHVIDLHSSEVAQLAKDGKAAVAEILLKQGIMRNHCNLIEENLECFKLLLPLCLYLENSLTYIFSTEEKDRKKLVNLLEEVTNNKREIMSVAEQFIQEGIQRGIQKGIQKGKKEGIQKGKKEGIEEGIIEVVKNMLKSDAPIEYIKRVSNLSDDQINKLIEQFSI